VVEVIKTVEVEKIVYQDRIVYRDPPVEPVVVVENKLYDSQDYLDWVEAGEPSGQHEHTFSHTHDGVQHSHRIVHPDGQADNWEREHDGWDGVFHE